MMIEIETKVCTTCGQEKPIEEFREYPYSGRRYTYCLECQRIEGRRRYLVGKKQRTEAEEAQLQEINKLYELRANKGLKTLGTRKNKPLDISKQIEDLTC